MSLTNKLDTVKRDIIKEIVADAPESINDLKEVSTAISKNMETLTNKIDDIELIPGPQGPQGPQGALGPQGAQGAQGPAGAQGLAGAKGNTGAQGAKGDAGAQGAKGNTGASWIIESVTSISDRTVGTLGKVVIRSNKLYVCLGQSGSKYIWREISLGNNIDSDNDD